ncbi:MAG TPA: methyl-accepting chemotaxis protein [archaeon]|nr:methyl-accepting chemotaxis protein [archaeon]
MKISLRHKIIGLALLAALLPVLVILIITSMEKKEIDKLVIEDLDVLTRENIAHVAIDVHTMCTIANELIQNNVDKSLNVARRIMEEKGRVAFSSEKSSWTAVNQETRETSSVTLPKMTVGGVWFGDNRDFSVTTPVVDEVKKTVGIICTIFQRMNEEGDMLRVATNIETPDKKRGIGTYISAVSTNGERDPIISSVLRGETYHGRSFALGVWYPSAYEPISDRNGKIIGMLAVGIGHETFQSLREAIYNIKVGKTGYVYVLGGKGANRGRYFISKNGERDGEDIWETRDDEGNFIIQSIVNKALKLNKGEVDSERYPWKNPGETKVRNKVAAFMYFEPWDWVIGAGTYEDDYYEIKNETISELNDLLLWSSLGGLIILGIAVALAFILGNKIARPITEITSIAQEIAEGNLSAANKVLEVMSLSKAVTSKDQIRETRAESSRCEETQQLLNAIRIMTRNLNSLVGQVQRSGIQVNTSTIQIAASARQLEATVSEQAASTNEVVATSKEISSTSRELVKTMNGVNDVALETASLADTSRNDLTQMETTISQLSEATRSIVSKLSIIHEKANNIDNVITTINKVADQTNLLSLNAAIEAEKAGEYGLGFSVVAREIRRLADQTAVSTLDIEHMVKEMQSAVSAGVMEMDKFSEEVREAVENIEKLSQQLEQIIIRVQELTPRFMEVNDGMESQSKAAQQISETMVQLNEAIQQTSGSLSEFNNAVGQLNEASKCLRDEVSRFKVSE